MMTIIDCQDELLWDSVLARCDKHDFYHLASYHQVELRNEKRGRALLFVYEEDDAVAAIPLLLRPLDEIDGLSTGLSQYFDATSVYGYPGPVANRWNDTGFFRRFSTVLSQTLQELNVISAFSRLHPVLNNGQALHIGRIQPVGVTLSIDLLVDPDAQFSAFRKGHRSDIRNARKAAITTYHDTTWVYLDNFVKLYTETMIRASASNYYLFGLDYFTSLREALGDKLHLFVALKDNEVIATALFTLTSKIVQYHLSGSSAIHNEYAASKVLIDDVRQWAILQDAQVFHLGGGRGAQRDSLYGFKAGFANREHPFQVWQYVTDAKKYGEAVQCHRRWRESNGHSIASINYFPQYRAEVK